MRHVVFLRAANVGGKNVFRPAQLPAALPDLGLVNVGAAGTFVVRSHASAAAIRSRLEAKLPFETRMAVATAADVLALVRSQPFRRVSFSKEQRGWVAALASRPKSRPKLPIAKPADKGWCVRFDRLDGAFALGLWHRRPGGFVFPNQIVEAALGVAATTRWWETLERVAQILRRSEG